MTLLRRLLGQADTSQVTLEERIQALADLDSEMGAEAAQIRALLNRGKSVKKPPEHFSRLTIEERVNKLIASQEHLAREVLDLKAALSGKANKTH